jgi:hypothetical protein
MLKHVQSQHGKERIGRPQAQTMERY